MSEFLQSITTTWGVIGTLIAIFGAGVGTVLFLEKRRREDMKTVEVKIGKSASSRDRQFDELECDIEDVKEVIKALDGRVGIVERNLETVARASDIARLEKALAEQTGAVNAQLQMVNGTVKTLYEAALRANQ
jgi:hypothetical protein